MKLIRFGEKGSEAPGIITTTGTRKDCSAFGQDYDSEFYGSDGITRLSQWISEQGGEDALPGVAETIRLSAPIKRPGKICCIGLNYSDHAAETGMEIPAEPVLFMKASSALCGPNDNLILPRKSQKTDWEVELAFIIGKEARYVDEADAAAHIAGYALHNDYSEREFQIERCGQWAKGKSCDTFAPLGPFLATPDEIADPDALGMWLTVNGEKRQSGSTSTMVYKIPFLLSYLSQFMTLEPGDVVSTGTPPGVGMGMDPQVYLKEGDVVELGIDGLGSSRQLVVAPI